MAVEFRWLTTVSELFAAIATPSSPLPFVATPLSVTAVIVPLAESPSMPDPALPEADTFRAEMSTSEKFVPTKSRPSSSLLSIVVSVSDRFAVAESATRFTPSTALPLKLESATCPVKPDPSATTTDSPLPPVLLTCVLSRTSVCSATPARVPTLSRIPPSPPLLASEFVSVRSADEPSPSTWPSTAKRPLSLSTAESAASVSWLPSVTVYSIPSRRLPVLLNGAIRATLDVPPLFRSMSRPLSRLPLVEESASVRLAAA